jgi:glycosyltransferase involved in cell wall biosynthesis
MGGGSGRLKVVFAGHSASLDGGGAELWLLTLAAALKEDGRVDPIVTTPREGELSAALLSASVPTFALRSPAWTFNAEHPCAPIPLPPTLRRGYRMAAMAGVTPRWVNWLRSSRPDLVVTCSAVNAVPAFASGIAGVPHIWWVHEFVTRDHGLTYSLGERLSQHLIGLTSRLVIVNSKAVRDHFADGVPRHKVRVLYQGIDGFRPTPNRVSPAGLRALVMGSLTPTKGVGLALEAVAALEDEGIPIRLRLVGAPRSGYGREIRESIARLGIDDVVEVRGPTADPQAEYDWANVVLTCSRCEAFGRVTLEALKSGRPVVGTRSGGTVELVSPGVNGLLFTPGSAEELAAALRLLASDPCAVETMSKNAGVGMRDRFTMRAHVDAVVPLLWVAAGWGPTGRPEMAKGRGPLPGPDAAASHRTFGRPGRAA